jgi:acyl carrier protein
MKNTEKFKKIFVESLSLDNKDFKENLKYNDVPEWDSIGHMTLMSGLEDGFKISLETDDIVDFSSYKKGMEILKKYKIDFKQN